MDKLSRLWHHSPKFLYSF